MTTVMAMDEQQRYLFDTFGYLVVPDVLTADQLTQLRSSLKHPTEQWSQEEESDGPLHWDVIWRDLLDLPVISPILEELVGDPDLMALRVARETNHPPLPTFRLDHINVHAHVGKGFKGGVLHGGRSVNGTFEYHDGRFYNGLLTVSFELYDTHPNDGGFACIAGTHKSNVAIPDAWRDLSQGVVDCVTRVAAVPGDAIIFTEALTHGTLPWTCDAPRSTVFYKYSPHTSSWGARFFNPEDFCKYGDMDDRKLAMLEPPNARYRGRPSRPLRRDENVRK
jgi:hypothetical protein